MGVVTTHRSAVRRALAALGLAAALIAEPAAAQQRDPDYVVTPPSNTSPSVLPTVTVRPSSTGVSVLPSVTEQPGGGTGSVGEAGTPGRGALSRTGTDVGLQLVVGAALVGAGSLAALGARRRRRAIVV